MFSYDPPAGWNDFTGDFSGNQGSFKNAWHKFIYGQFADNISDLKTYLKTDPLFFSGATVAIPAGQAESPIPWNGFPRRLTLKYQDRPSLMAAADDLVDLGNGLFFRPQDEYLEWRAMPVNGTAEKFVFTAEAREYWTQLSLVDTKLVEHLYGVLCDDPTIKYEKLRVQKAFHIGNERYNKGDYNPWNEYNTKRGCVHLTHPANSIGAEINLAAFATVQRKDANGQILSEFHRLACCSNFGTPDRSSDPTIGQGVNLTVRGGVSATLANPVGLYIGNVALNQATGPNGESVADWWTVTRGAAGRGLRAEFAPPVGATFGLADVLVRNEKLTHGGQLAELVTMVIYAQALKLNVAEPAAMSCENRCCVADDQMDIDNAIYDQIGIDANTPAGEKDAFPELKHPTMSGGSSNRFEFHLAQNID